MSIPFVEGGHHVLFEKTIEGGGVRGINGVVVVARLAAVDYPAIGSGVTLGPPAIGNAQVRDAIHRRLHPAGAAGLERLARIVQPHVTTLRQKMCDMEVVVVDKRHTAAEQRIERAPIHMLQMMLANFVSGM